MSKLIWRIVALMVGILPSVAEAQQSSSLADWLSEYRKPVEETIRQRQSQRPNFAADSQFTHPDYIVYIPKVEPQTLGDCYNDHFQVFDGPDGTLYALTCQATREGAPDQHVTFFRSEDAGKTWSEPKVLAGAATMSQCETQPIASWGFPLVSRSGRIYVLYNQYVPGKVSTNRQHTGNMTGIYSDDRGDTWSEPVQIPMARTTIDSPDPTIPPEWVVWQKPLRLATEGRYLVGCSHYAAPPYHSKFRTVTEFMRFENIDDDPTIESLQIRHFAQNDQFLHCGMYCEEPSVVQLPDGRLFSLMRTGMGHPSWSVSSDGGETWTEPQALCDRDGGTPFAHPMSPCPIYDRYGNEAASGEYFAFVHNRYDPKNPSPWQNRGPLYLVAGKYEPKAEQPIWFTSDPKLFVDRPSNQSFYTSVTVTNGKTILWYPDQKFYLLGRVIDAQWFPSEVSAE